MDVFDLLLLPVYLGIFYIIALRIVGRHTANPLYKKYYSRGLIYKFIGALSFAFIYLFYYKGGDSINFYYTTIPLFKLVFSNPAAFFAFVLNPTAEYPPECYLSASSHSVGYLIRGSPSLTTIRITAILNIFSFNSYLVLCMLSAFITYQFQWRVFILVSSIYPDLSKQFAYAFLMIPSVLFWGSGAGKDSIMLGCIMFFFYCFYHLVILKRNIFKYLFLLLITGYIISLIRAFILFTMAPCLMLMAVTYYRNAISSSFLRFFIGPIFLIGGVAVSILFIRSLGQAVDSYSIDSLQQKAEGFKSWHSYLGETQGGSFYKLGEDVEYTPAGIIRQAPLAILITLYGPFVWQIRNIVMLLSGIESLFFLIFSLRVVFNKRIYNLFGILLRDHLIVFCAPLVIILSVAIGLTSFNYGALVRYRIPILPFFATMFIIINYHMGKRTKAL
jgi:hypothetical protein